MADDFFSDISHLGPVQGSQGPSTSFLDNWNAAWDAETKGSGLGYQVDVSQKWQDQLKRAQSVTGQNFDALRQGMLEVQPSSAEEAAILEAGGTYKQSQIDEAARRYEQAQRADPTLMSMSEIQEIVKRERAQSAENYADISSRAGTTGTIGGFVGGMAASFQLERNPINAASIFLGGGGRTLATRMLTEGLAAGAGQGASDVLIENPQRRALGEEEVNPFTDAALAGLFGAAGRGVFEGAGALGGRIADRVRPGDIAPLQAGDDVLGQMFSIPETREPPTVRAARYAIEIDDGLRATNPYGDSPGSMGRMFDEMQGVSDLIEGRSSTAVGRFLPSDERWTPLDNYNADLEMVRAEQPALAQRVDETQARLDELNNRENEITTRLNERGLPDAVSTVDDVSGQLVRGYQEALDQPNLSSADRAELQRRIDQIVEELGPDLIAKMENDATIGDRAQLKDVRRARRNAQKEFNRSLADVTGHAEDMRQRQQLGELLQSKAAAQNIQLDDVTVPLTERVNAADVQAKEIPDISAGIVERNTPEPVVEGVASAEPREPGVDIGLSERLPDDFTIYDEAGNPVSAKSVMDDLVEDENLLAVAKACGL